MKKLLFIGGNGALGVSMWLCFSEYDEYSYAGPPLIKNVLKIKSALCNCFYRYDEKFI